MTSPAKSNWPAIVARICSVSDAADLLGIGPSRIKELCADGTLRGVRNGRAWIVDRLSVNALARARSR